MSDTNVLELPVNMIEECDRTQVRSRTSADTVKEYAEMMSAGAIFDPIVVYQEKDTERYIVSDGHHRLQAALKAGVKKIRAKLKEGDEVDALEHALGANQRHGLRLTDADRERAVGLMLSTERLTEKYRSDQDRADHLGLSLRTFRRWKQRWAANDSGTEKEKRAKAKAQKQKNKHESKQQDTAITGHLSGSEKPLAQQVKDAKKARSQDEVNRDEFFAGAEAMRTATVYGGAEAVTRWQCADRVDELVYLRNFLSEMIIEISKRQQAA